MVHVCVIVLQGDIHDSVQHLRFVIPFTCTATAISSRTHITYFRQDLLMKYLGSYWQKKPWKSAFNIVERFILVNLWFNSNCPPGKDQRKKDNYSILIFTVVKPISHG